MADRRSVFTWSKVHSFLSKVSDPPLLEEDLPSGEWLCHRCRTTSEVEEPILIPQPCGAEDLESEIYPRHPTEFSAIEIDQETVNPLNVLITAATVRNPTQYQLPYELSCTLQLPGSSKKAKQKENRYSKRVPHELDSGIVHLPAKLCFHCKKSCRKAPLIQCDYCPLLFHTDCLEPPLTSLPTGRWMCFNHSEFMADQKLLTSVSFSERVKLWDKFSGPVSQDAMKLHFLTKVDKHHPPSDVKSGYLIEMPLLTAFSLRLICIKSSNSNQHNSLPNCYVDPGSSWTGITYVTPLLNAILQIVAMEFLKE
ncbi:PHD finger protein 12 [Trichonephila clavipes]|uniref:PHD finger protein 12 n=1 Tax=Trichonephila clavipes TaxID=2585209 RepID=A0A8X6SEJ1_TRICX|nr:PHD finger protein 12 [Trichonephila clavipes]